MCGVALKKVSYIKCICAWKNFVRDLKFLKMENILFWKVKLCQTWSTSSVVRIKNMSLVDVYFGFLWEIMNLSFLFNSYDEVETVVLSLN